MTILAFLKSPPVMALIAVGEARRFLVHLVAAIAIQLSLLRIVRRKRILEVYFEVVRVNLLAIYNIVFGALFEICITRVLMAPNTPCLQVLLFRQRGTVFVRNIPE